MIFKFFPTIMVEKNSANLKRMKVIRIRYYRWLYVYQGENVSDKSSILAPIAQKHQKSGIFIWPLTRQHILCPIIKNNATEDCSQISSVSLSVI
jgi:hypothetical protein